MGQEISKTDYYQEFIPVMNSPTTILSESDKHFIANIFERKTSQSSDLRYEVDENCVGSLHTTQSAPELLSPVYQPRMSTGSSNYSLSPNRLRMVSSQPNLHLIGTPTRKQRILMLGLDGAGKSTLFQRIRDTKKGTHAEAPLKPSIAYNVTSLDIDGRACTLWDVSGSPLTRDLWKHYFSGTDCLVWVVDSSNLCRLQESRTLLQKIVTHRALRGVPVVVVANKQDLPTARNSFELEEVLQLDLVRQEGHFVKVVTTSATTGKDTRKVLKKFRKILKTKSFDCDSSSEGML